MIPFSESSVEGIFDSYPNQVRPDLLALRDLVFTTAQQIGTEETLVETLKWGEPSYVCPGGSTLRMHWKTEDPDHYRIFFHCQTKLISTFRRLYRDDFHFEGNRAIRLELASDPDLRKLAHCIEMSLNYHAVKDLPLLGNGARPTTNHSNPAH